MWIKRDISNFITQQKELIQVLRGPRQCGKSSLFLRLDSDFTELSLDDPQLRLLAQNDPEVFLSAFAEKNIFIDEIQYAPNLLPSLKRKVDLFKRSNKPLKTIIRLTGSNQILMDKHIKESLAGRANFFNLNTLSIHEILNHSEFSIQKIIYYGGWPELYARKNISVKKYLDDYISSYIEKDIVLAAGIQKRNQFLKFVQLLAGRVGNLLNYDNLAKQVGVKSQTIVEWVSILEKMHIISLLQPFNTNLSSRLTKSPKIFFLDTGLACRLQGWTSAEAILTSPQQGGLFENLVYTELYKLISNYGLDWKIFHWRTKDGEEVDFLLQTSPTNYLFLEAKVSHQSLNAIDQYREVKRVFSKNIPKVFLCHQEGSMVLKNNIPIKKLSEFLLKEFS
ncbi:MAG: ATP-binding protein [Bdellovibrionales bacterium]|nr:ATP-binding protein [Bdellovibrionales bacterium]